MPEFNSIQRTIRSFVNRNGRITPAQRHALEQYWPQYGVILDQKPLLLEKLFSRQAPVILEIGFGMGDSLYADALTHTENNYLGIEVYPIGIAALIQKLVAHKLQHVRIIQQDAVDVITHYLTPHCIDEIRIFFPDPWPKKRHHKRRLIQIPFIESLLRILKKEGVLHIATDWADYAAHIQHVLSHFPQLQITPIHENSSQRRPATKYEKRGMRLGHNIQDFVLHQKTPDE